MKYMKFIGILLIVVLIGSTLTGYLKSNKTKISNVDNKIKSVDVKKMNEGTKAADFELMDLQGKSHKLSDYVGKKVYIKYWASWCSICLAGLGEVNTLAAQDKDFEVITIVSPSFRGEMNSQDFKKWFSGLEYKNLTVLLDEKGIVASTYEVRGYPTSVFIGSDGILVKILPGHKSNDVIVDEFKNIK
ncbi:redoxin domain-containing protein [Clostridium bowmanii]|uniref:redoxin domain-containing protein n=1 Tax=Clostridium bowmanii TaxID=132925 RepID=UPI001C0B023F|nr:redoxin domain-containing protein [Clostridium bowmanii]MBU3188126.1 redoxin domain-containing protein [Clostridium bowmanii]MCA1072308.1 redoxin domain-containing protein [Clostridium bowmanii]